MRICNRYNPRDYYERIPEVKKAIDQILKGYFTPQEKDAFDHLIVKHLLDNDRYILLEVEYTLVSCTNLSTFCLGFMS